jgi:hypothetical protein
LRQREKNTSAVMAKAEANINSNVVFRRMARKCDASVATDESSNNSQASAISRNRFFGSFSRHFLTNRLTGTGT